MRTTLLTALSLVGLVFVAAVLAQDVLADLSTVAVKALGQ